jgi:O-acetyl-ADP-ribose deacetylase (regulator of RNase III)
MDQAQKRMALINALVRDMEEEENRVARVQGRPERRISIDIPDDEEGRKRTLRSLFNVRAPRGIDDEFLKLQDEYLQEENAARGVVDYRDLTPVRDHIYLWQGDITTIKCDAIVNAANSGMTGCYIPCHACIDNAIHTYAGIQLRNACADLMRAQGHDEPPGEAKITSAFNLPCKFVLHTVGPMITGPLTSEDEELLQSCYLSCLELADEYKLDSIAFCCISTGVFHFPPERAAEIAVDTVDWYRKKKNPDIDVIFNVFKDSDYDIYKYLLSI